MEFRYLLDEQTLIVQVERSDSALLVTVNGRTYAVSVAAPSGRAGEVGLTVDGRRVLAWAAADGPRRWVALAGAASAPLAFTVPQPAGRGRRGAGSHVEALEAQMPGVVRRVLTAEGEAVERGQLLVVLEAMKMEIRVSAPRAGVVGSVSVAEGQAVERGQALIALEAAEDAPRDVPSGRPAAAP